jgi:hypothetical protein
MPLFFYAPAFPELREPPPKFSSGNSIFEGAMGGSGAVEAIPFRLTKSA